MVYHRPYSEGKIAELGVGDLKRLLSFIPDGWRLMPNRVGNLAIRGPYETGSWYVGYIDLVEGKIVRFDEVGDGIRHCPVEALGAAAVANDPMGWVEYPDYDRDEADRVVSVGMV